MGGFIEACKKVVKKIGDFFSKVVNWFIGLIRDEIEENVTNFLIDKKEDILKADNQEKFGDMLAKMKAIKELEKVAEREKKALSFHDQSLINSLLDEEPNINIYDNDYIINNNDIQNQMQLNQINTDQSLNSTNYMLGRALSKAEYYSSRFGKNIITNMKFDSFNNYNNGIIKDKIKLKKSLINTIDSLQDFYELDGPNRIFPSNFGQNQIIDYINYLKDNCFFDDKKIFDYFICVIKGEHIDFDLNIFF